MSTNLKHVHTLLNNDTHTKIPDEMLCIMVDPFRKDILPVLAAVSESKRSDNEKTYIREYMLKKVKQNPNNIDEVSRTNKRTTHQRYNKYTHRRKNRSTMPSRPQDIRMPEIIEEYFENGTTFYERRQSIRTGLPFSIMSTKFKDGKYWYNGDSYDSLNSVATLNLKDIINEHISNKNIKGRERISNQYDIYHHFSVMINGEYVLLHDLRKELFNELHDNN